MHCSIFILRLSVLKLACWLMSSVCRMTNRMMSPRWRSANLQMHRSRGNQELRFVGHVHLESARPLQRSCH